MLRKYGYPAVLFVPIGYLDDNHPLPHEEGLAAEGMLNPTVDWEELAELEREGIRIESHGISHRPLADLEVDEAAREITLSKLRLEERLGRPVRAFSYVKGSEAHYKPVHLSLVRQAGYDVAFTAVSGANSAVDGSAAAAPVQHRAVSAADVRARSRRGVRPDLPEGHGQRARMPGVSSTRRSARRRSSGVRLRAGGLRAGAAG